MISKKKPKMWEPNQDGSINLFYSATNKGWLARLLNNPAFSAFGNTPEEAIRNLFAIKPELDRKEPHD